MATPDYSKIWGANSPLAKYEFTEADYLRGWEFIGSMPPARTMFDAWMRKADEKMRWLYDNAFSENSLGGFLFWRLPDTAYFVGEKRALQDGPLDVYLECTIAGRTSKEQMKKLPQGAEIGKTFVDGTATWLVRQFATNAALADHRTKTPLDHPDGSVLKKHLGFEVYDKGETDARLNVKANANHGYHVPAPEAANNTRFLRNDNTWQTVTAGNIGAYTKGETYTKSEIDSRVNGKVSKSGDTMTGALMFSNNIGECVRGVMADSDTWRIYAHQDGASNKGYLAIDLGDDGDEALYVRQFSGNFTTQVRLAKILGSDGTTMFPISVTSQSFYASNWFRALGDCGFYFENHGGGWYMADDEWIRAYNGKNIYTSGKIRCDAGFEGDLRGTAGNANTVGNRSLQWILEQINAAKTGIVAGNLERNGWVKFANGLIVQWGVWGNLKIDQVDKLVKFHMPFPDSCFIALLTLQAETVVSGANNVYVKKGSLTRTGLTIVPDYSTDIIFSDVFYVALGR